ncbi:hypothetical protein [Mucilaginibacter celer]|uniref:NACHT domain-containing protein n=1 Tax=Mucilaginibacter celer TaxID=2305508 RepID=A0A494W644_9SPHI|nr:hypothetical protein [Mucilaginibacter celer]AYL98985.1 hypothetical protein HYN43_028585 [Mucilaginibacter celer]
MTSFSKYYFEGLKKFVLVEAGLSNIAPADCKTVEAYILEKTKQRVSETTLKRIYGFAYSKFNPSMFTLNTLARYCDYEGWDDFCKKQEAESVKQTTTAVDWDLLKINAGKITSFTLQALKNKTGIPYTQTIRRQFIDDHFAAFLQGDYTATVIAAPAGYGKTVALCHWVDEKLQQNNNDIILFFSSNALMNVFLSGRDINDWMLGLLGYSIEEDIVALLDLKQRKEGRFFLIVDGVDEHMFKNDQFQLVLNQLVDIFSFYQSHDWFKLILTMRSSTWINYHHTIEMGQSPWFEGFFSTLDQPSNVPLFSIQEIKELCLKINPAMQNYIAVNVAENFNHPLYFQFYYKEHKKNFSLDDIDHVSVYELISNFILNKVYMGQYSADKIYVIQAIVEQMDFGADIFEAPKLSLINLIKHYNHAYFELLSIGFIREQNFSSDFEYKASVEFSNNHFLEFSIARYLLQKNTNLFNIDLITTINRYFNGERKLSVLKWCIIYAIKSGQRESFQLLSQTRLTTKEKSDLILFLGDLLEKEFSTLKDTESLVQYFKQDCGDELFDYLFGLEFVNNDYGKTLHTLLKFELSDKKRILVYTALATLSVVRLEMNKLEEYLKILSNFGAVSYYEFPLSPLKCLNTLYQYLKYGIINKDFFKELTRFYFRPPLHLEKSTSNDLIFLISAHVLKICNEPLKTLRFVSTLETHYRPVGNSTCVYDFFIKLIKTEEYLTLGLVKKAIILNFELDEAYKKEEEAFTPLMLTLLNGVKIMVSFNSRQLALMNDSLEEWANAIINETDYKLLKVYMLAFLLRNQYAIKSPPERVYKHISYIFLKTMSESGLRADIFLRQNSIAS